MSHGGYRRGSGRKSNAQLERVRSLMDGELSDQDWKEIFRALATMAKAMGGGAASAAHLLMLYRFGVPNQEIAEDVVLHQIKYIEVVSDKPSRAKKRRAKVGSASGAA